MPRMKVYQSRFDQHPGTSLDEVMKLARQEYHSIQKRTPRRVPYIRSKYFTKDKIFINAFWGHLNQKSPKERVARLRLYACAIDLLRNCINTPETVYTRTDMENSLHRFYGKTNKGSYFCVQVKENKRTNRKDFMSVFPINKSKTN